MEKKDLLRFKSIPTLRTDRLRLRRMEKCDLYDVFKYTSDPEVPKYLLWEPHSSLEETRRYLARVSRLYRRARFYDWGVEHEGRIIGTVGFTSFDIRNDKGEIGYVISRDFWHRGIASEAVRAVLKFGFESLLLNRIEARFLPENEGSLRVAQSCGMTLEGTMREALLVKGRYRDVSVAAVTAEEYFDRLKNEK